MVHAAPGRRVVAVVTLVVFTVFLNFMVPEFPSEIRIEQQNKSLDFLSLVVEPGLSGEDHDCILTTKDEAKDRNVTAIDRPHTRKQIIAILPGPHKTGSTTVQTALYHWINTAQSTTSTGTGFRDWAFPVPSEQELALIQPKSKPIVGAKSYSPFITRLFVPASRDLTNDALIKLYATKIQQAWDEGFNIVIPSEHLDRLATETTSLLDGKNLSPELIWSRLLDCLPKVARAPSQLVIGIQHRTPRISHLISMWHHLSQRNETLLEYITKPTMPGWAPLAHSMNSLGLADFFVQRGYKVVIVDTGGVVSNGVSLPATVACHVLQLHCVADSQPPLNDLRNNSVYDDGDGILPLTFEERLNSKPDPSERELSDEELQAMDQLLVAYDCQFMDFLELENVHLVHADKTFSDCSKKTGTEQMRKPFSETIREIVALACHYHPRSKYCK